MNLWHWLTTPRKSHADRYDTPTADLRAPLQAHPATCCGRSDFVQYATIRAMHFDGQSVHATEHGAIVTCTHCGEVWGVNEHGLYRPSPESLPGPLALSALKRQQIRNGPAEPTPMPSRRNMAADYRVPKP